MPQLVPPFTHPIGGSRSTHPQPLCDSSGRDWGHSDEGGRVIAEAVGIVAGILTLALLYRLFFSDGEELLDAIVYWFTPDAWSFFRGRLVEDWFASFKLGLWIAIGGVVGFGVYAAVADAIAAG